MPRNILITGAANGLGKSLTETFAGRGDIVFATDIDPGLKSIYQGIENIIPVKMDVTDQRSIQNAYREIRNKASKIDVLINNAGISGFYPLLEVSEEKIQKSFRINTFGPFRVTRMFSPLIIKAKGKVINISSESAKAPTLFQSYAATKIAMEGLMKSVGQELYLKGVQTTFIRPGVIKTAMNEVLHSLKKGNEDSRFKKEWDVFIEKAPKLEGRPIPVEKVAQRIFRIAGKRRLKIIYRINNNPLLDIARLLPYKVVIRRMKRMLQ